MNKRSPQKLDKVLGTKIRTRRLLAKMSQAELGEALDVSFQQIQKYEKGANRVGFVRLQQIARALGESVNYFTGSSPNVSNAASELATTMNDKDCQRLVKAYRSCPPAFKRHLVLLVESLRA